MASTAANDKEEMAILMARVKMRDRAAFSRLYELASPRLLGFALCVLKSRELAEEALQDAFIRIWNHSVDYQPEKASANTWMTTIVRNRCLDMLRVNLPESSVGEDHLFEEWASEDLTPIELASRNSDARALVNCMKQLAPMQRQAIVLSYFHGLAHDQLAKHLTQPLGTIKSWVRRGLQSLKLCLGQS